MRCHRNLTYMCSAAVWVGASLLLTSCAETDDACRGAGIHVLKKIPRISGYVDTTGNGCNLACEVNLRNGSVDYVDLVYTANRFDELIATGGHLAASFRRPPSDGSFRAALKNSDVCRELREKEGARNYSVWFDLCLEFTPIEKPVGDFEMSGAFSSRTTDWGRGYAVEWTFLDRSDKSKIATAKDYQFFWNKRRLLVPDLPPDYRCVELHSGFIDLRQVYGAE